MFRDVDVPGFGDRPLHLRLWPGGERSAVVLPGANYPPTAPLLYCSRLALQDAGLSVVEAFWSLDDAPANWEPWLDANARAAVDAAPSSPAVVAGKSLATIAMARLGLDVASIWLTPLLGRPEVVEAIGRSPRALVVGGTADDTFVPDAVEGALLVEGGNHALETGDAVDFARTLLRLTEAVRDFAEATAGAGQT